jgi:hypothetical protein
MSKSSASINALSLVATMEVTRTASAETEPNRNNTIDSIAVSQKDASRNSIRERDSMDGRHVAATVADTTGGTVQANITPLESNKRLFELYQPLILAAQRRREDKLAVVSPPPSESEGNKRAKTSHSSTPMVSNDSFPGSPVQSLQEALALANQKVTSLELELEFVKAENKRLCATMATESQASTPNNNGALEPSSLPQDINLHLKGVLATISPDQQNLKAPSGIKVLDGRSVALKQSLDALVTTLKDKDCRNAKTASTIADQSSSPQSKLKMKDLPTTRRK